MIKKFSSPKIKIWFEPMFFYGFFCGFRLAERGDNFKFLNDLSINHSRKFFNEK